MTSRDYINVDLLESFYLNQIHKTPTGKDIISVTLAEKLMLLEIYKKLCLGNNGGDIKCQQLR